MLGGHRLEAMMKFGVSRRSSLNCRARCRIALLNLKLVPVFDFTTNTKNPQVTLDFYLVKFIFFH